MSNERIKVDTNNQEHWDVCAGNPFYNSNPYDEWNQDDDDSLERHLHEMGTTMEEFTERIDEMDDNNIDTVMDDNTEEYFDDLVAWYYQGHELDDNNIETGEGDNIEEYCDYLVCWYYQGLEMLAAFELWRLVCKLW